MGWTQKEIESVYMGVRGKAMTDADFRKKLLADPPKAIAEFSGKEVPAGFKVKVLESDPAYQATFVVPDLVSEEMNEESLSKVAGGVSGILIGALGIGACLVAMGSNDCLAYGCAADVDVK